MKVFVFASLLITAVAGAACAQSSGAHPETPPTVSAQAPTPPKAEASPAAATSTNEANKAVFMAVCNTCHSVGDVIYLRKTKAGWAATLQTMQGFGATITDDQKAKILDYLVTNHGQ